jgi:hypothetical protein
VGAVLSLDTGADGLPCLASLYLPLPPCAADGHPRTFEILGIEGGATLHDDHGFFTGVLRLISSCCFASVTCASAGHVEYGQVTLDDAAAEVCVNQLGNSPEETFPGVTIQVYMA